MVATTGMLRRHIIAGITNGNFGCEVQKPEKAKLLKACVCGAMGEESYCSFMQTAKRENNHAATPCMANNGCS